MSIGAEGYRGGAKIGLGVCVDCQVCVRRSKNRCLKVCVDAVILTLQTVGIEQILALVVAFDAALRAAHALSGDTPQQPLAFVAVGWGGGCPNLEVVWSGGGDGVDQSLQGLFVNVTFLQKSVEEREM